MNGSRPRHSPNLTSCEPLASGSSRPATPNVSGWNATYMMAPSNAY
jgi:hypothetical protein